jgi:microcin C transport system permease protein
MIPTFIGITALVFTILQVVPGGPFEQELLRFKMAAMASSEGGAGAGGSGAGMVEIPEEALQKLKEYYGLDKPAYMRYFIWLKKIVQLDLGKSYKYSEPVWDLITERVHISAYFGIISFLLSYLICIPLGIFKAIKHGSKFDKVSSAIVFVGYSIPGFIFGAVLLVYFGGGSFWDVFPLGEFRSEDYEYFTFWGKIQDQLHHTVLPVMAYMVGAFASTTVLMKNSLLENLSQDYVRTAFAKGLSEKRVIFFHAVRNSLIPLATGIGGLLGIWLAGSYLIERVFNIDGIGMLSFNSILNRDYPVTLGFLVVATIIRLLGNLLSDICYAAVDPRIRFK